jgi:hypothetical protein
VDIFKALKNGETPMRGAPGEEEAKKKKEEELKELNKLKQEEENKNDLSFPQTKEEINNNYHLEMNKNIKDDNMFTSFNEQFKPNQNESQSKVHHEGTNSFDLNKNEFQQNFKENNPNTKNDTKRMNKSVSPIKKQQHNIKEGKINIVSNNKKNLYDDNLSNESDHKVKKRTVEYFRVIDSTQKMINNAKSDFTYNKFDKALSLLEYALANLKNISE